MKPSLLQKTADYSFMVTSQYSEGTSFKGSIIPMDTLNPEKKTFLGKIIDKAINISYPDATKARRLTRIKIENRH